MNMLDLIEFLIECQKCWWSPWTFIPIRRSSPSCPGQNIFCRAQLTDQKKAEFNQPEVDHDRLEPGELRPVEEAGQSSEGEGPAAANHEEVRPEGAVVKAIENKMQFVFE